MCAQRMGWFFVAAALVKDWERSTIGDRYRADELHESPEEAKLHL
jgi:hypothetical protein